LAPRFFAAVDPSTLHTYLDPGEALGEILFGLIMALTLTLGSALLTAGQQSESREIMLAVVGCNVAWGVIDGVLLVLGRAFHRSRRARFIRALQSVHAEDEALAAVRDEFAIDDESLVVPAPDSARFYEAILAIARRAVPRRRAVFGSDVGAAVTVFVLVSATALPAVLPFLLIGNPAIALRASNVLLVLLLFVTGYWWGHLTDVGRWWVALTVTILGLTMVAVAIALGG
jgi:VIT1/CCC1 family predicted Fe2+/Mn2+ transporter